MEKKYPIVSVSGFCATGSSAAFDLLCEYSNVKSFPYEFRILKESDGFFDLGNILKNNWQDLNVDIAIRRFINLYERFSRSTKWYRPLSYGYNDLLGGKFEPLLEVFLNDLGVRSWYGSWPYHWHEYNAVKWFLYRVLAKFHQENIMYKSDKMYIVSYENFLNATKKFMNSICDIIADGDTKKMLVFDQLIPTGHCDEFMQMIDESKMIVVDRDPRDVFVRGLIWPFIPTDNVDDFICWFKTIRDNSYSYVLNNKNVLLLRFEDLIYKYDESVAKIEHFLGLYPSQHTEPMTQFIPEKSAKNTMTWEKLPKQTVIKIENELGEYCYDFSKVNK